MLSAILFCSFVARSSACFICAGLMGSGTFGVRPIRARPVVYLFMVFIARSSSVGAEHDDVEAGSGARRSRAPVPTQFRLELFDLGVNVGLLLGHALFAQHLPRLSLRGLLRLI